MSSIRRVKRFGTSILAVVLLLAGQALLGQGLSSFASGEKSKSTEASTASDRLKRTTPRSSIYNFLETCHQGNYALASQYLDLPRQLRSQGPDLAKDLGELLDRNPQFEVDQLNNTPEGDGEDGLSAGLDTLGSFQVNRQEITLLMQRVTQHGVAVWLVSSDSVARIPALRSLLGESRIEKMLPRPLVTTQFIGTPIWVWIALVLLALILSLVSRALSRVFLALVKPLAKRYAKTLQAYRLEAFTEPLRLLLSVVVFRACMEAVAPSALLRDYLLKLITLLFVLGCASLAMRVVDIISDRVISRLDPKARAISYSVFPLFVRFAKICLFCIAVLVTLEQWGYNTNTILAGLGVGGLAVALAAQKTLENLFGGISVISDRPVLVGDFCQFGGQAGTVEDIGLRSTRIRTLDRTVVTIPNAQFSTMTLENFSKRDRVWFHPTLHLRRDTKPGQIREMMDAVTKILQEHAMVDASGVPLRFTKITDQSFDLEIFAYVLTADYNEFLKLQSELLLKFLEAASERGIDFAIPVQESIVDASKQEGGQEIRPATANQDGSPPGPQAPEAVSH